MIVPVPVIVMSMPFMGVIVMRRGNRGRRLVRVIVRGFVMGMLVGSARGAFRRRMIVRGLLVCMIVRRFVMSVYVFGGWILRVPFLEIKPFHVHEHGAIVRRARGFQDPALMMKGSCTCASSFSVTPCVGENLPPTTKPVRRATSEPTTAPK